MHLFKRIEVHITKGLCSSLNCIVVYCVVLLKGKLYIFLEPSYQFFNVQNNQYFTASTVTCKNTLYFPDFEQFFDHTFNTSVPSKAHRLAHTWEERWNDAGLLKVVAWVNQFHQLASLGLHLDLGHRTNCIYWPLVISMLSGLVSQHVQVRGHGTWYAAPVSKQGSAVNCFYNIKWLIKAKLIIKMNTWTYISFIRST